MSLACILHNVWDKWSRRTWAHHCGLAAKSGSIPAGILLLWRQHRIEELAAICCTLAVVATVMKGAP